MNRRDFLKKSLKGIIVGSIYLISCGDKSKEPKNPVGPNPPLPSNKAPNTEITTKFMNDGNVEYTFKGTDSDGSVNYIAVKFNNGSSWNVNNNSSKLVEIIKGSNTVKAIAYDNEGLADPSPKEYFFNSSTEEEAKSFIGGILVGKRSSWKSAKENALLSLGEKDNFSVDYLVEKNDGTNAVINYIGYKKDLNQEISNQGILSQHHIPNLYIVRIPESEINLKLNDFINKGFN